MLDVDCGQGNGRLGRRGGQRITLGNGNVNDLGGDIINVILLVNSLVDWRCNGQSRAERGYND